MSTVTYTATKDADAWKERNAWNGHDGHILLGRDPSPGNGDSFATHRGFVYFPINFSGMNSITSATLTLVRSDNVHMAGTTSSEIHIHRMNKDWGEGSGIASEGVWSTGETWDWNNRSASFNDTNWGTDHHASVGTPDGNGGVEDEFDVTTLVLQWAPTTIGGSGAANYGFWLANVDEDTASKGLEYHTREASNSAHRPKLTIVYTTKTAPSAPVSLSPTGGAVVNTLTPTLTGTRSDPDTGDYISAFQVKVFSDAGGTVLVKDSGTVTVTGSPTAFAYSLPVALTGNTDYWWKARTRDRSSLWGPYCSLQAFTANRVPTTPTNLLPADASTIATGTPIFKGASSDPDPGDGVAYANVIVYTDAAGSAVKWNSGDVSVSSTNFSVTYAGSGLSSATTYYWKVRTKDTNGQYSNFTQLRSFTVGTAGTPTDLDPVNTNIATLSPEFTATAATSSNAFQIILTEGDLTTEYDDTGIVAMSGTAVSYTLTYDLDWATKYGWKVRTRDTLNVWSAYSAVQPFWTNSPPVALQVSPLPLEIVGTLTPAFTSTFTDPDKSLGFGDTPSVYTVEVVRNSDNVTMHTLVKSSGLTAEDNSVSRAAEGTALSYNIQYKWRAKFTDDTGASNDDGTYSGFRLFKPSQPPTVGSLAADAGDLTAGSLNRPGPTFTWTFSGSGGKTQVSRRFIVTVNPGEQDEDVVYDTLVQPNTTTTITVPLGILENLTIYEFYVAGYDIDGLYGTDTTSYYTDWTAPPSLTGISATGDEENSRVILNWNASDLDPADFNSYTIYRSLESVGVYELIYSTTDQSITEYIDYDVGLGVSYRYKITQWQNVDGSDPVESPADEEPVVLIAADDWWIVVPGRSDLSMSLNVTDEGHQAPAQEETFEPFGRRRKVVVRSGVLGTEGDISFIVLNEDRETDMAKLDAIIALNTTTVIKSPFGDAFKVYLSPPSLRYLTGGHVTVTCSYVEVE